ncbi:MAG: MaoC family dehydratase [Desulfobacteraceae bacterium]|nr:MAG: MaoC family dehydratase [Desulfobacteraceae bacterium]
MTTPRERAAHGLQIGDVFTVSRTLASEDIVRFAEVSRDYNPVHFDERFARVKNFTAPICHGLLAASLVTEIGGQIGWLASGMNFRFRGPVYVGETVTCTLTITEIDSRGRARADALITNQGGIVVIEAQIRGIVPGEAERKVLGEMLVEGDPTNRIAAGSQAEKRAPGSHDRI